MSTRDLSDLEHLSGYGDDPHAGVSENATWRLVDDPSFLRHVRDFVATNPRVSTYSFFLCTQWRLDIKPPAAATTNNVGFEGIAFDLMNEMKVALLVAMAHPASKRLAVSTAQSLGRSLAMLGGWMTHVKALSISHLGAGFGELFMQALFEFVDLVQSGTFDPDSGDWDPRSHLMNSPHALGKRGPSYGLVEDNAAGLIHLWDMRFQISELTGAGVHGAPFKEKTAYEVAKSWGESGDNTTKRLPPVVQLVLEKGARRLMGQPASDVVRLVQLFVQHYRNSSDRNEAAAAALEDFDFSTLKSEGRPWWSAEDHVQRQSAFYRLARLVHLIRDAAAVLVLLAVGMRPQEFLGLMGGSKERTLVRTEFWRLPTDRRERVPRSVTEMLSKSGYTVLLILNGHVFKREQRPRAASWLMGGRQDGGADPVALDALCVLEDLHEPLREFAVDGADGMLIVDFVGVEDAAGLATSHCGTARIAQSLQRSIPLFADFSGIPDREGGIDLTLYKAPGNRIALYQFRKTWAQSIYKLEPPLLPAISRQLQHRNPEETKRVYVTQDPDYLRELEGAVSMHTSLLVREVFDGEVGEEGTMSPSIDAVLAMMGPTLSDGARAELWRARVARVAARPPADRLRPLAGMANLAAEVVGGPSASPFADAGARDGPAAMRAFVAERRRWLGDLDDGQGDLARPSRDRALIAARRLNECGFPIGNLADGLATFDDFEEE